MWEEAWIYPPEPYDGFFDSRLKIGYQMRETFVNRLHLNTSEATDLAKEKLVSVNLKKTRIGFWVRIRLNYQAECYNE